jgi:hypothetical protein
MQMVNDPLPDIGLERFTADWREAMGDARGLHPSPPLARRRL